MYCVILLADQSETDISIRYTAGICLKSVLSRGYSQINPSKQEFLEQNLFNVMTSDNELLRRAGKLALISIVSRKGILHSESILEFFVKCIK
jgi:hypothetical protein